MLQNLRKSCSIKGNILQAFWSLARKLEATLSFLFKLYYGGQNGRRAWLWVTARNIKWSTQMKLDTGKEAKE